MSALDRVVDSLDRLGRSSSRTILAIATLLTLLCVMWPVTGLNPNEEGYFLEAYVRVSGDHPDMSAVVGSADARIVTEWVIGAAVSTLGFEGAQVLLRVLQAAAYALGLAVLFSAIELTVLESVGVMGLFVVLGQSLMGGDWLFNGVEGKTFAYALVLPGIGMMLKGRWRAAIGLVAAATYFHFLVGGFWALVMLVACWGRARSSFRNVLTRYLLMAAPVAALVVKDQLANPPDPDSLSSDYIYAALRVPHHTAPFESLGQLAIWADGIMLTVCLLFAFVVVRHVSERKARANLVVGLLAYLVLALVLSLLDRGHYLLAKFYLFRPSSVVLLLALAFGVWYLREELSARGRLLFQLGFLVFSLAFIWNTLEDQVNFWLESRSPAAVVLNAEERKLVEAVQDLVPPNVPVLIEPFEEMKTRFTRLHRELDRPTVVSWKIVPTTPQAIQEWYARSEIRRLLFLDPCSADSHGFTWLVTLQRETYERVSRCGETMWRGDLFALVRLTR